MTYAKTTEVPIERSKMEIEQVLRRYGADQFLSGWDQERTYIGFRIEGRQVKLTISMPNYNDFRLTPKTKESRTPTAQKAAWEQGCRQRMRALLLVIKAKLEAVELGITTVESEFLANIMLPDGRTVGTWAGPQLEAAYGRGTMPALLPGSTQ